MPQVLLTSTRSNIAEYVTRGEGDVGVMLFNIILNTERSEDGLRYVTHIVHDGILDVIFRKEERPQ